MLRGFLGGKSESGDPKPVLDILQDAKGNVAYDIGAHVGRVSKILSSNFNIVFAFEPSTESFETLRKIVNPKIKAFNIAISEKSGFIALDVRTEHIMKQQLVDPDTKTFDWGDVIEKRFVPALSLDSLFETLPQPDFIKIDTEGYEAKIIRGGENGVNKSKAKIFVEIHSEQNGKEIISSLEQSHSVQVIRHPGHTEGSSGWLNHFFILASPKNK
jgi:FkbM family methyltransferase